jgi:hypothetical protein
MKNKSTTNILLLLILPWVGFITSLKSIQSKSSAFVYIAFAMLYGFSISFINDSADSYRYAIAFTQFDNTLNVAKISQLYKNGELRDVYRLIIFYVTSIFTKNPKIMFAFAGTIYGVFSYLNIRILAAENSNKTDKYFFILNIIFFTYCSIANINGFRFWTGAMFLFYAMHQLFIQKKYIWIIGVCVVPLFHYGFIVVIPVLILFRVIHGFLYNSKKINPLLIYVFAASFIASLVLKTNSINIGFLAGSSSLSGEIGNRLNYVNSAETAVLVDNRRNNSLFLSVEQYFDIAIKIYVFISVLYINTLIKRIKINRTEYTRLFSFVLMFYSFTFIATKFPSGGRFLSISHLFFILLLGKLYANYQGRDLKKLILWGVPAFSFYILYTNFLLPFLILTPTFWYGNYMWILFESFL